MTTAYIARTAGGIGSCGNIKPELKILHLTLYVDDDPFEGA